MKAERVVTAFMDDFSHPRKTFRRDEPHPSSDTCREDRPESSFLDRVRWLRRP